jgi:hypothetical protein
VGFDLLLYSTGDWPLYLYLLFYTCVSYHFLLFCDPWYNDPWYIRVTRFFRISRFSPSRCVLHLSASSRRYQCSEGFTFSPLRRSSKRHSLSGLWAFLATRVSVCCLFHSTGDRHTCLYRFFFACVFMQFPVGSSILLSFPLLIPSWVRVCSGSFVSDLCRYDRLVTSLSHYGILCALRVSLSHLCDFVKEIFPFWIVGAPHPASEIPLLPRFHRRPAVLSLPPFPACVSCDFLLDL